jgi:hypothetical protein
MVKRSVRRQRRTVTAADLQQAQSKARQRKTRSLTRAARERFVARAKKRGLTTRAAETVQAALPQAPSKLQQREARVRAGMAGDPLAATERFSRSFRGGAEGREPGIQKNRPTLHPDSGSRVTRAAGMTAERVTPLASRVESLPDPPAVRGRQGDLKRSVEPSLTDRVRALYEDGVVPVREIARLVGVTERTLYKYAARGRWRKRYARRALAKGAGGRFVADGEESTGPAPGFKALDPVAAAAAEAACAQAEAAAGRAAAATLAEHEARTRRAAMLQEFETRARRFAALVQMLKTLSAACSGGRR